MVKPFRGSEDSILCVELGRRIDRDKSTITRWRQTGALECVRVGGYWTVSRAAWDLFLERCNPPTPSPRPLSQLIADKRREAELAHDDAFAAELGL
jgi:hypothetical protein